MLHSFGHIYMVDVFICICIPQFIKNFPLCLNLLRCDRVLVLDMVKHFDECDAFESGKIILQLCKMYRINLQLNNVINASCVWRLPRNCSCSTVYCMTYSCHLSFVLFPPYIKLGVPLSIDGEIATNVPPCKHEVSLIRCSFPCLVSQ